MGLTGLRLYGAIAGAVAVALLVAWVFRIDSLRARHVKELVACQANHAQFVADVKAKVELARISDAAHKAEVDAAQQKERADHEAEVQHLRADYAGRVRDYAKAHPGGSGKPAMSAPTNSPSEPVTASSEAVVPVSDLEICASNTAAAEGWLSWWKSVEAIPR